MSASRRKRLDCQRIVSLLLIRRDHYVRVGTIAVLVDAKARLGEITVADDVTEDESPRDAVELQVHCDGIEFRITRRAVFLQPAVDLVPLQRCAAGCLDRDLY